MTRGTSIQALYTADTEGQHDVEVRSAGHFFFHLLTHEQLFHHLRSKQQGCMPDLSSQELITLMLWHIL